MQAQMIRSGEQFAKVGTVTLCYESFGDGRAPTILLVMGLGMQMVGWSDGFCEALAGRGYRVVRFDNRDTGRSSRIDAPVKVDFAELIKAQLLGQPISAPYALRDMAVDAIGLLDHLDIARAHVVGASMGGMIGQEMAINFPHRLASLTSIMSSTGNPALPPPSPEAAAVLMAPPPVTREDYIATFAKNWRVLRAGSFPEDEARDRAVAELTYSRGLNPMGVARQLLAIFVSGDRRAKLAKLTTPTLVIHGDVDPLVRVQAGEDTAKTIPGARLTIVKGMGHAMPMTFWPTVIDSIVAHAAAHPA